MTKPTVRTSLGGNNQNGLTGQHEIISTSNRAELQAINPDPSPVSRRYYWKNLAAVSLGVLFVLTGYSIRFYIQSSLHKKGGLGSIALALEYSSQVLTCLFLPPFLMRIVGYKWSLVLSSGSIAIFIVTNLKESFAALVPAAIFLGLGSASLWATMNTVVSNLALGYARLTGGSETEILSLFFSIFFSLVNTAVIWANLLSSYILSAPEDSANGYNGSLALSFCGAQYCDELDEILSKTLYGEAFVGHHQEAFSNHRIWDCLGFALGFSWSHYLCTYTKIYIILGFIAIGTVGYLIVELRLKRRRDAIAAADALK